jgi:hypothetical protein
VVRLGWGGLLVVAPGTVLRVITGAPPVSGSQVRLVRVLGTRHVVQAAVEFGRPTSGVLCAGAAVDLLHAMTCAGAVALAPEWRRPALVDGVGALLLAGGGLLQVRNGAPRRKNRVLRRMPRVVSPQR